MKNIKLSKLSILYILLSLVLTIIKELMPDSLTSWVIQKIIVLLLFVGFIFLFYVYVDGDKTMQQMDACHASDSLFEKGIRSEIWSSRIFIVVVFTMFLFSDVIFYF